MSKRYRVEIAPAAERDIDEIYEHIAMDSPGAAVEWVDVLVRAADTLAAFPLRCPLIPESAAGGRLYRHLIHGDYRIIFRLEGTTVWVVRVAHGARLLDSSTFET